MQNQKPNKKHQQKNRTVRDGFKSRKFLGNLKKYTKNLQLFLTQKGVNIKQRNLNKNRHTKILRKN